MWQILAISLQMHLGTVSINEPVYGLSKNIIVKMASFHLLAFQRSNDFKDSSLFSEQFMTNTHIL